MSLDSFMRNLLCSVPEHSEIDVVYDNATAPSEQLLAGQRRVIFEDAPDHDSSDIPLSFAHRHVLRCHSEPIHVAETTCAPRITGRWDSCLPDEKSDTVLVPPRRSARRRWSVSRNHSDSSLSRAPKRSTSMPVSKDVLVSLRRKVSASKVIAGMANATRVNALPEETGTAEISEDEVSELLIEQLIEVPDEKRRRQQEGNARFIQSILEDAVEIASQGARESNEDATPSCAATRRIWNGIQATVTFFLLVVQILAMEIVDPVVGSLNHLLQSLLAALPTTEEGYDVLLPLFGVPIKETNVTRGNQKSLEAVTRVLKGKDLRKINSKPVAI